MLAEIEEPGSPRPVAILVAAGDAVLEVNMLGRLSGSGAAVAEALEAGISEAARKVEVWPRAVQVRHVEVAEALRARLAARDVAVALVDPLPVLEEMARSMMEGLAGAVIWPPVCRPSLWSAWQLPRRLVADVFDAAAAYWRAAPWRVVPNLQAPRAVVPTGRAWTACILGNARQEYGLALYSDADDVFERLMSAPDDEPFRGVRGRIVTLDFTAASDLPDATRHEARLARWETAGRDAFPMLTTVNTPGGGVTEDDVADLILLLRAVPAFVAEQRFALLREQRTEEPCEPIDWRHEETGVRFRYAGEAMAAMLEADPDVLSGPLHEDFRAALAEAVDELGDASPDDLVEAVGRRMTQHMHAYNERPQAELGGLSPAQVGRLLGGRDWTDPDSPIRLRRDLPLDALDGADTLHDVRALLARAVELDGLAATDAGNLKLTVVADMIDRLRIDREQMDAVRSVSKRITEQDVWPLHEARILAQVDGLLVRAGARFLPLESDLLDDVRAGELYARLFETCFRRFDLSYGRLAEWPELQHQIPFTLYMLGSVASRWTTARAILDSAVLPYVREHAPESDVLDIAAAVLASNLLTRLAGFGLLETRLRPTHGGSGKRRYRVTPLLATFLTFDI